MCADESGKEQEHSVYVVNEVCYQHTIFFHCVVRHRFRALLRNLHFCDNSLPQSGDEPWKIPPVLDHILKSNGTVYNPEHCVAVDKSDEVSGRLSSVQLNPSKRASFGSKFYILCESSTGYCFNSQFIWEKVRRLKQPMGY